MRTFFEIQSSTDGKKWYIYSGVKHDTQEGAEIEAAAKCNNEIEMRVVKVQKEEIRRFPKNNRPVPPIHLGGGFYAELKG